MVLQKRGRIPLQARPVKRKDIDYYSNEKKRGYLVKENDPLLQQIQQAQAGGHDHLVKKGAKKSALELQLESVQDMHASKSAPSRIITLEELTK